MQIDICGSFIHNNENWKHNYMLAGANMKSHSVFLHRGLTQYRHTLKTRESSQNTGC